MKVDRTVQLAGGRVSLAPDDGVFAIAGTEPAWIWVHTCPTPGCSCRTALVLATNESRDVLLARGAVVREAWNAGTGYAEAAAQLEGLVVFDVDIDTAEAFLPNQREPLDLARNPPIGDIVARIDGELLDAIGRLWYRGKSLPDPEQQALLAEQVIIRGWQPGDLLAWDDACTGVRQDFFVLDGRLYEAAEMYCPVPGCECGEVVVHFETLIPRGAPSPGGVLVQRSGATEFEPGKNGQARLEQLWAAFRKRHPGYLVRFARRYPAMKTIGARIAAKPVAGPPKVGRNDPCPCGSGKKHKKCCAASSTR